MQIIHNSLYFAVIFDHKIMHFEELLSVAFLCIFFMCKNVPQ